MGGEPSPPISTRLARFKESVVIGMDNDNKIQIQQILNIIKISSLAFPAIAFLQYYSKMPDFLFFITHGILIITILIVILLVYTLWIFIQSKISNKAVTRKLIDPIISMSISLASVILTGSYASSYKFLFIFVIFVYQYRMQPEDKPDRSWHIRSDHPGGRFDLCPDCGNQRLFRRGYRTCLRIYDHFLDGWLL